MRTHELMRLPKAGQVYGYGTSTTHQVYEIPAAWKGQRVTFQAVTYDFYINFGTSSSVEVATSGVSTLSTYALTATATTGVLIPAGQERTLELDNESTHFAIEAPNTGAWRGWLSDAANN